MSLSFVRMLLVSVILLGLTFFHDVDDAAACTSGPGPTFEEQVASSPVIVRGRLVESDLAYQNYILQVDEYLVGGPGPEFLLLAENSPSAVQALLDTNVGGGDCRGFEIPEPELELGYFMLNGPTIPGAYWSNRPYFSNLSVDSFPITIYEEEIDVDRLLTPDEFEAWVADVRDTTAVSPLPDSRYPSTAPLLVTDVDGNEYILPVSGTDLTPLQQDSSSLYIPEYYGLDYEPVGCASWDCVTITDDNRTFILEQDDEYLYIQDYIVFNFSADHFVLSPIGMAVWIDNMLQVYALHDTLRYFSDGDLRLPRFIDEMELSPTETDTYGVWSADGLLLAFSDAEGLWLWYPYREDSAPQRLVPNDEAIPRALHFAGNGRYLAVEEGDARYVIDLITRETLPFGYISPDGQLVISCNAVEDAQGDDVCTLMIEQLAPVSGFSGLYRGLELRGDVGVEWVNARRALIYGCNVEEGACGVIDTNPYVRDWGPFAADYNVRPRIDFVPALAYDVQGRNIAILNDGATIIVNDSVLEFDLDSPIESIRWLPTLFYGEAEQPPLIPPIRPDESE